MYVDLWSQGKSTDSGHSMLFQNVFPFWKKAQHNDFSLDLSQTQIRQRETRAAFPQVKKPTRIWLLSAVGMDTNQHLFTVKWLCCVLMSIVQQWRKCDILWPPNTKIFPHLHPPPEILKNGGDDCVFLSLLDLLSGWPNITKVHLLPLRRDSCISNKKSNVSAIKTSMWKRVIETDYEIKETSQNLKTEME